MPACLYADTWPEPNAIADADCDSIRDGSAESDAVPVASSGERHARAVQANPGRTGSGSASSDRRDRPLFTISDSDPDGWRLGPLCPWRA